MDWQATQAPERQPRLVAQITRMIQNERLSHALLLTGDQGTGKLAVAHFIIQLTLCENPQNVPCETCRPCRLVTSGNHLNVHTIEPDGQFIKRAQIDQLIHELSKTARESSRKFYIVHDAHRMNASSANALLKFLEEPTSEVTAILLTNQPHALLPTIRSRCQQMTLQPVPPEQLKVQLIEQNVSESMASTVSKLASSLEDALAMVEEEEFGLARKGVLKLMEALERGTAHALVQAHEHVIPLLKDKEKAERVLDLLLFAYRDIVANKANPGSSSTFPDKSALWEQIAMRSTFEQLTYQLEHIMKARRRLHQNANRTLLMEQLVIELREVNSVV